MQSPQQQQIPPCHPTLQQQQLQQQQLQQQLQQQQQQQQQPATPLSKRRARSMSNLDVLFQGVELMAPEMNGSRAHVLSTAIDSQSSPTNFHNKHLENSASEVKEMWRESRDSWSTEPGSEDEE